MRRNLRQQFDEKHRGSSLLGLCTSRSRSSCRSTSYSRDSNNKIPLRVKSSSSVLPGIPTTYNSHTSRSPSFVSRRRLYHGTCYNKFSQQGELHVHVQQEQQEELEEQGNNNKHLIQHFESLIEKGDASNDEFQKQALMQLDRLRNDILFKKNDVYSKSKSSAAIATVTPTSISTSFIGDSEENETSFPQVTTFMKNLNQVSNFFLQLSSSSLSKNINYKQNNIKGLYLHGGVGCGKTFCMNLFYDSLPQSISKQKVHFHSFMLNVHKQVSE